MYKAREFNRNWSQFGMVALLQVDNTEHGSSVLRVYLDDSEYVMSILCLL